MHIGSASHEMPPQIAHAPSNLVGVKGWLLWFCISLTILSPIVALAMMGAMTAQSQSYLRIPGIRPYLAFLTVMTVILVIAGICIGVMVWRRRCGAHILARRFLLASFAIGSALPLSIFGFVDIPSGNVGTVLGGMVVDTIKSAVPTFAWYFYLIKSKRVRATFGPA